jgi:hypothetical protein
MRCAPAQARGSFDMGLHRRFNPSEHRISNFASVFQFTESRTRARFFILVKWDRSDNNQSNFGRSTQHLQGLGGGSNTGGFNPPRWRAALDAVRATVVFPRSTWDLNHIRTRVQSLTIFAARHSSSYSSHICTIPVRDNVEAAGKS